MHPLLHKWAMNRQTEKMQRETWVRTGCLLALSARQFLISQIIEKQLRPHLQSFINVGLERLLPDCPERPLLPILLKCGWILESIQDDSTLDHLLTSIFSRLCIHREIRSMEFAELCHLDAARLIYLGDVGSALRLLEQMSHIALMMGGQKAFNFTESTTRAGFSLPLEWAGQISRGATGADSAS